MKKHSKLKTPSDHNTYKYKWLTLIGLGMAIIVLNLDMTIVNLAVPVLGKIFHARLSLLEWIVNIYALTFAACVILTGKLADKYGHKKIYLYGVSFFLLGSAISGFAPNPTVIIIGRFLQGIGMAGTFGMVFLLAASSFPPNKRGLAVGTLVVFAGVGQAIGPTVGGLIVSYWSWRWCFLINIPFCILSIILVYFTCKKDSPNSKIKVHYPSAILLILSIFLVIGALNESQTWGISNWKFLTIFAIGIVVFILNMFWQSKLKTPLLNFKLYKHRDFLAVNLIRPFFQFSFSALLFILPLYLQNGAGYNAATTGKIILIMTIMIAIASPITGKIIDIAGPAKPIAFGQMIAIIGYLLLSFVSITNINWYVLSIGLALIGANIGIMFSATNFLATASLPNNEKGIGFGMFAANGFFSTSLGIAVIGYIFANANLHHFHALAAQHADLDFSAINQSILIQDMSGARPITNLSKYATGNSELVISIGKQSLAAGFKVSLWLLTILSVIGLFFCYFLKKQDK